jgi:hypothetical protein
MPGVASLPGEISGFKDVIQGVAADDLADFVGDAL